MSHELEEMHFVEICTALMQKHFGKKKATMSEITRFAEKVADLTQVAWNSSIPMKNMGEMVTELNEYVNNEYAGNKKMQKIAFDAADMKWHGYRDDQSFVLTVDVRDYDGHLTVIPYFLGDEIDDDVPCADLYRKFTSPEMLERLKKIPEDQLQEEISKIIRENMMEYVSDEVCSMRMESLRKNYNSILHSTSVKKKQKELASLLKVCPYLKTLCENADECFKKSEAMKKKEANPGSLPEIILAIAAEYADEIELKNCDPDEYREYSGHAKDLCRIQTENEGAFFDEICGDAESGLLLFILEAVNALNLSESEQETALELLFTLASHISYSIIFDDDEDYQDEDDPDEEEEYDFDANDLTIFQLHVKLRGFSCSADVLVPENITFEELHNFLNPLFKRDNDHLYRFRCDDGCVTVCSEDDDDSAISADKCYLGHHMSKKSKIYYLFDYGDEWEHDITVKNVMKAVPGGEYPSVLKITGDIPEQYPDWDEED